MTAAFLLLMGATMNAQSTIVSRSVEGDPALTLDREAPLWTGAGPVAFDRGRYDEKAASRPTEVRSRWSRNHLYLFFVCPYERLHLKPNPSRAADTDHLWDWDVAEAFIGTDPANIGHYTEYEVSPQGEWVDLEIERGAARPVRIEWNSGFESRARIDETARVWYAAMKIPMKALGIAPAPGLRMRVNFYRIEGPPPDRTYLCWRPVHAETYHTPEAFGVMELAAAPAERSGK